MLCPVLGFSQQERYKHTKENLTKGHGGDEGIRASLLLGKAERTGTAQSGEGEAQGSLPMYVNA